MAKESSSIVCLCPGQAPAGGSDIWNEFRRIVHPTTTTAAPEIQENCERYKILLGIGWSIAGVIIVFTAVKFVIRKLKSQNDFERLVSPDEPATESNDD